MASRAVVEPRPNFCPRAWSSRVFGLNTLALIFVFGRPSASMRTFVARRPIWSRTRLVAVLSL